MQIEIVNIPVNEIIPYWRNPRRNDKTVEALVEVIQKNGFNVPIVVDKNYVVVKGHARLKAAKRLGMETVPCIISNASEDVIKADRISDNKIQELSAWDFGKLNIELDSLGKSMVFGALFRPEERITHEDVTIAPAVEFKPAGLQFWDGDFNGNPEPEHVEIKTPSYDYTYTGQDTYVAPQSVGVPAQDSGVVPQKRQLKTLCPYCGKVVFVSV